MEHTPRAYYKGYATPELKAINEKTREVAHLITNATVDRAGDSIDPTGADVSNYLRNPVVMADHAYGIDGIIGTSQAVEITKDGIFARTKFHDKTQLARDAWELVKAGVAKAWSVGFRPTEHESIKDDKGVFKGFRFKKWELLEYSLVAIPANPDIVMSAVSKGMVHQDMVPYLFAGVLQTPKLAAPGEAVLPTELTQFLLDAALAAPGEAVLPTELTQFLLDAADTSKTITVKLDAESSAEAGEADEAFSNHFNNKLDYWRGRNARMGIEQALRNGDA